MVNVKNFRLFVIPMGCLSLQAIPVSAAFYVGGQFGSSLLKGEHEMMNAATTPPTVTTLKAKKIGFQYGAQLGYQFEPHLKNFFFVEALGMMGGGNVQKSMLTKSGIEEGTLQFKRKMSFGAAVGLGMRFHPALGAYLRVGYEWSTYDILYKNIKYGTDSTEKYNTKSGEVTPGMGLLFSLSDSWFLKCDYIYGINKNMKIRKSGTSINGSNRQMTLKPSEHRLMIHINYHFK